MNAPVKCPNCKEEGKQGYIYSTHRISWSESGDSVFIDYGNEVLIDQSLFKISKTPAYRCEQCKLVIFSYDKK
ncbi:hypothetical protein J2Z40_003759 [Cytobacillus eiseniae]|uniref:DUF6487 domain-containing protein n=1 Tax=Cytobacillus eiseniae TaxID=762947 RepID=A0ABS4RJX7_9BACI|nr:PF20097 family protein [Cytobacillus eiseniae]MBP2243171.1 hypothetical protein [Cytobacillus eiseniae]